MFCEFDGGLLLPTRIKQKKHSFVEDVSMALNV